MARKRRRKPVDPRIARLMPERPDWRWRTLPVWLALTGGFIIGWYTFLIGSGAYPGRGAYILLYVVLAAFAFGLSRIVRWLTERWIVRRRLQRRVEPAPEETPRQRRRREQGTPTAPET